MVATIPQLEAKLSDLETRLRALPPPPPVSSELKRPIEAVATAVMAAIMMLATGLNMVILEMHLLSYGTTEEYIGFWFSLFTLGYTFSSIMLSFTYPASKPAIMAFGCFLMAFSYMLIGPCPLFLSENFVVCLIGLHLLGWSISLIYGKF